MNKNIYFNWFTTELRHINSIQDRGLIAGALSQYPNDREVQKEIQSIRTLVSTDDARKLCDAISGELSRYLNQQGSGSNQGSSQGQEFH